MYSRDFKLAVVAHYWESNTKYATAEKFNIGTTAVIRWSNELEKTGDIQGVFDVSGREARKIDPEELKAVVENNPDFLLKDIASIFNCTNEGVRYAMKKAKITRKKK
jgi:transposase